MSTIILDEDTMQRAIKRIAHEIVERNKGANDLALIGIQRRGVPLAIRIAKQIKEIENVEPLLGILDITLYRDDLSSLDEHPIFNGSDINFQISGKNLVMIDDVLYTGRTIRSGIEALLDMGRPASVQLAVLIDRGHRELPIRADYVGKNIPTATDENIKVHVREIDGDDCVVITRPER